MQHEIKVRCPKPSRIRELIELIESDGVIDAKANCDLLDTLDWVATQLENRTNYHKRRALKDKYMREKLAELGLDDELTRQSDEAFVNLQTTLPKETLAEFIDSTLTEHEHSQQTNKERE